MQEDIRCPNCETLVMNPFAEEGLHDERCESCQENFTYYITIQPMKQYIHLYTPVTETFPEIGEMVLIYRGEDKNPLMGRKMLNGWTMFYGDGEQLTDQHVEYVMDMNMLTTKEKAKSFAEFTGGYVNGLVAPNMKAKQETVDFIEEQFDIYL